MFSSKDPCLWKPRLSSKQQCTDSPRIQTHQKVPSYSSTASSHHSLGLKREDEGYGKTEAEPRKNDRNKRTVSAGHRTYSLVFAFIFPQMKKRNQYLFASQKNILMEAKAFKVLFSCPNVWEEKESSVSGAERERLSWPTLRSLLLCSLVVILKYPLKKKRSQMTFLFLLST